MIHDLENVFNEAQFPTLTYVNPKEYAHIKSAIRARGKHVTISGASGSGKTTIVKKALSEVGVKESDLLAFNGREFKDSYTALELLGKILKVAPTYDDIVPVLLAVSFVLIDDFHHLSSQARDSLAETLKLWHEKGVRFILIGISSSARNMVSKDTEVGIRNDPFDIKTQDADFVRGLMAKGEDALKIKFSEEFTQEVIAGSKGVPSIVQVICRMACIEAKVEKTCSTQRSIDMKLSQLREPVLRIFSGKYFDKIIGLAKGKQQARSVHNTYFDIVASIAREDKSDIPTEYLYRSIVGRISDLKERSRKQTSYYNCLKYLSEVIRDNLLDDVIYYQQGSTNISIEDPTFRFYLNLLDIQDVKKRLHIRSDEYPWDVAVSFAGEDRDVVSQFVKNLEEQGISVFYDFNYQAKLWGVDLQTKLAEIYANEAKYLVIFISHKYPEKDWTKFEFEVGRQAAGKRMEEYLLPIYIEEDVIMVGLSRTIGRVSLRTHPLEYASTLMMEKINQ